MNFKSLEGLKSNIWKFKIITQFNIGMLLAFLFFKCLEYVFGQLYQPEFRKQTCRARRNKLERNMVLEIEEQYHFEWFWSTSQMKAQNVL